METSLISSETRPKLEIKWPFALSLGSLTRTVGSTVQNWYEFTLQQQQVIQNTDPRFSQECRQLH